MTVVRSALIAVALAIAGCAETAAAPQWAILDSVAVDPSVVPDWTSSG
jgi:hypothetical protein